MAQHEGGERDRDPGPPALDEEEVEEVVLAGEVARDGGAVLDVGVARGVVGRGAGLGADEGEERPEGEERRVEEQDEALGRRREGRRVATTRPSCCCRWWWWWWW